MRTIKFRAWDKFNGEMYYSSNYDNLSKFFLLIEQAIASENGVELMQFTGFLDKNGKEIYEGDIIKDKNGSYGKIIWHQESMSFKIDVKNGWQHPLYDGFDIKTIEIIGTIYENPELLK